MSVSELDVEEQVSHNPRRGREPRQEAVATQRRRRKAGSLNRMVQYKLDCIEPSQLDLENYVYRWVNDEPGKLRMATHMDDYDHVPLHELGQTFDAEATDSESSERVRMLVGTDRHGNPTYSYLLKKPREFWTEDNEAMVQAREDMMAGRVYRGDATDEQEDRPGGEDKFYVPEGTQIGSAAARRKGPIPRRLMKAS